MRKLYLVGKALPEDKARHNVPFPSGSLTDLVALDPRHGVFPNLVMTPLLATIIAFYEDGDFDNTKRLLDQVSEIVKDETPRRFNVLSKPIGPKLRLDPTTIELLARQDMGQELWLVFKHSSAFALISHLLTDKTEFTEGELNSYGGEFLRRAANASHGRFELPAFLNTQVGLLFRLCVDEDCNGDGVTSYLRQAVGQMAPTKSVERIVSMLRCLVPLLHNDAYDKIPIGLIQNRFMLCEDLPPSEPNHENPPADPYWRFIGKAIKRRLLTQTTPTP